MQIRHPFILSKPRISELRVGECFESVWAPDSTIFFSPYICIRIKKFWSRDEAPTLYYMHSYSLKSYHMINVSIKLTLFFYVICLYDMSVIVNQDCKRDTFVCSRSVSLIYRYPPFLHRSDEWRVVGVGSHH